MDNNKYGAGVLEDNERKQQEAGDLPPEVKVRVIANVTFSMEIEFKTEPQEGCSNAGYGMFLEQEIQHDLKGRFRHLNAEDIEVEAVTWEEVK